MEERQTEYLKVMSDLTIFQPSSEEELKRTMFVNQMKMMGATAEQVKEIEEIMFQKQMFEPDDEIMQKVKDMLAKS